MKVGDRVRRTNRAGLSCDPWGGRVGTIVKIVNDDFVAIAWDEDGLGSTDPIQYPRHPTTQAWFVLLEPASPHPWETTLELM